MKKRKIEFSKLLCIVVAAIIGSVGIYSIFAYYHLCKIAIENDSAVIPDSNLPMTCVSVVLGAFLSYCLYQFGLKNSRNRYHIDENGEPRIEHIEDGISIDFAVNDKPEEIETEEEIT